MTSPSARYLVPLSVAAVFLYFLFKVHEVLLPFILGATLAYLLSPLVGFFEIRGFRRRPIVVLVFGSLLAFLSAATYFTVNLAAQEASRASVELPRYVERGQQLVNEFKQWGEHTSQKNGFAFSILHRLAREGAVMDLVDHHWRTWPGFLLQKTPSMASHVVPFLELFFLVPLIAFLLMLEGPSIVESVLAWVPAPYVEMVLSVVVEIDDSLGNYMRGLCLKSFFVTAVALLGFWVIGLDYAIQLSVLNGFLNFIPLVGPVVSAVAAGVVSLCQWGSVVGLLKVLAICALVRFVDDGVLQVVILKYSVELHPILILFALMAGGALWGFWGLLFALPLACMVKVLLEVLWEWYRSEYSFQPSNPAPEVSHIPLI